MRLFSKISGFKVRVLCPEDSEMLPQYLSGSQKNGFFNVRFASSVANTWFRARKASTQLGVQIDTSCWT